MTKEEERLIKCNRTKNLITKLERVIGNTHKNGRLWQLGTDKKLIATYKTLKDASEATNINMNTIAGAVEREHRGGGYYWIRNNDEVL